MEDLKKVFAGKLLAIKAVKLQPNDPFTWASGWKSPFYCDNRQTLSYHDVRSFVKLGLTHAVLEHFPRPMPWPVWLRVLLPREYWWLTSWHCPTPTFVRNRRITA